MLVMPPLPYLDNALEPHISAEVIKYHYYKHTKKYYDVTSGLIEGTTFEGMDLVDMINKDTMIRMDTKLFNNASQAWNHTFFWEGLTPSTQSGNPSTVLAHAIDEQFGSYDDFMTQLVDKANKTFGSSWVWVVYKGGRLAIKATPNATSPLTEPGCAPIWCMDCWEHAWYLDYKDDKLSYIKACTSVINWEVVNQRFTAAEANMRSK